VDTIIPPCLIEVSEEQFHRLALDKIEESRWVRSKHPGYFVRVDPERPDIKQRRHVHIAHEKHLKAKGKQVSWNVDQTRHDRKNFDTSFKGMVKAHDIAKQALGLRKEAVLEQVSARHRLELFIEEVLDHGGSNTSNLVDTLVIRVVDSRSASDQ
jgi:hypothetical protein